MAHFFSIQYWLSFFDDHAGDMLLAFGKVAVILAGYFIVRMIAFDVVGRLITAALRKASSDSPESSHSRFRAIQTLVRDVFGFLLSFVAIIMVLQAVGVNVLPLLTTASVAGLAVGIGAQKLVKDTISGFFILIEDQYGVGDMVTVGNAAVGFHTGTVEELGMRNTRVRYDDGRLCILSNGEISQVVNHSRGELKIKIEVAISASADMARVADILNDLGERIAEEMPIEVLTPFKMTGIIQTGPGASSIEIEGGINAKHEQAVRFKLNDKIREALVANHIDAGV